MALDDAPSAGLTLRVSVEGTHAAGTSARSAVAAHHCSHNNDAVTLLPGHRGRRRSDRLLPERARFLPDRSQIPAPSVLTESSRRRVVPAAGKVCPARVRVRLLPEHLRPLRRTRPSARLRSESKTPQIGHFRKELGSFRSAAAPRSVISVAARPRPRGR